MKKSSEQIDIQKTLEHVHDLDSHGRAIADEYEIQPGYHTKYVNDNLDTFSLSYVDQPTSKDVFVSETFKRFTANTLQKLIRGDATFGHSAQVKRSPLSGNTESTSFIRHDVPPAYTNREPYTMRVYEKERPDPSDPGTLVYGDLVISREVSGIGTKIEDSDRLAEEVDAIRSLTPDQFVVPENNGIAAELNHQLVASGKKSFDTIFGAHNLDPKTDRVAVQFMVGEDNPLAVDVTYEPSTLQRGGVSIFSPIARLSTVVEIENDKKAYLSYYVKLNDAGYSARVSAAVSIFGETIPLEARSSVETPDMLRYLDEILATIAQQAEKGKVLASEFTFESDIVSQLEKHIQPKVALHDGTDLRVLVKALVQDTK